MIIIKVFGVSKGNEIRCCSCGKLLAVAQVQEGWVSIKCKCGVNNKVIANPEKKEIAPGPSNEKREYAGTPHY